VFAQILTASQKRPGAFKRCKSIIINVTTGSALQNISNASSTPDSELHYRSWAHCTVLLANVTIREKTGYKRNSAANGKPDNQ
jgi:hypothetical protein